MRTIPTEHQNYNCDWFEKCANSDRHLKHYQEWLDRIEIALSRINNSYRQPKNKWASKVGEPTLLASENKQAVTNIQQLHLNLCISKDGEVAA